MSNTSITTKRIYFDIEDNHTICSIMITSDEPENPYWGDGWKHKKFPVTMSVIDIMREAFNDMDYLSWDRGRYTPPEYKVNKEDDNG